jgi:hypothetical protein
MWVGIIVGHPHGSLLATTPAECWMILSFSLNCSSRAALICGSGYVTRVIVPAWWNPATLFEKCLGVVRHNVPREVDWMWRACWMVLSVAWPQSIGIFSHGDASGTYHCCYSCQYWHTAACTGKYHAKHCCLPQNAQHSFQTSIISLRGTLS